MTQKKQPPRVVVAMEGEDSTLTFAEVLDAARAKTIECPGCSATEELEDNGGCTLATLSFCCTLCGEQFDATDLTAVG